MRIVNIYQTIITAFIGKTTWKENDRKYSILKKGNCFLLSPQSNVEKEPTHKIHRT